jgi:hypothetical protein
MIVGSDDLVGAGYIAEAVAWMRSKSMIRPRSIYFVNAISGEAVFAVPRRLGAGRIVTAALLDAIGWELWESGKNRQLDQSMDVRLASVRGYHQKQAQGVVVDIKSDVNLWGWEHVPRMGTKCPADALGILSQHFPLALSHLQDSNILTSDAMAKAQAKKAPNKAPAGATRLVARINIPAAMTGTGKRVFAGKTFDAPRPFVKALVRGGLAEEA